MMAEFEILPMPEGAGLKVVGELDLSTAPDFSKALLDLPPTDSHATLDFSELTFIDSCGIHAILAFAKSVNGDGPVVILNPSKQIWRVFEILDIAKHSGIEIRTSG